MINLKSYNYLVIMIVDNIINIKKKVCVTPSFGSDGRHPTVTMTGVFPPYLHRRIYLQTINPLLWVNTDQQLSKLYFTQPFYSISQRLKAKPFSERSKEIVLSGEAYNDGSCGG